eukprot:303969-Pleurochrysis_carterae.AAC.2
MARLWSSKARLSREEMVRLWSSKARLSREGMVRLRNSKARLSREGMVRLRSSKARLSREERARGERVATHTKGSSKCRVVVRARARRMHCDEGVRKGEAWADARTRQPKEEHAAGDSRVCAALIRTRGRSRKAIAAGGRSRETVGRVRDQ